MGALFRLILIGFFIYLVLKFIGRLLFPWHYISNTKTNNYKDMDSGKKRRKEGDVSIENVYRDNNKIINKDEGEYIDYEEIKD